MPQMTSCPRTTPERPRSMRASSASKPARAARAHERPEEAEDALARQHQVRREHQRDEEDEDDAAHARRRGRARRGRSRASSPARRRSSCPTASAITRFGSNGSPFFSCAGSTSQPLLVSVTTHAGAHVDGERAVGLRARDEGARRGAAPAAARRTARGDAMPSARIRSVIAGTHFVVRLLGERRQLAAQGAELERDARGDAADEARRCEPRTTA